ncbi:MAG: M28 family peptidase [Flavobacteriaceae bacterium]|nr:M28 family peptidase [Flavobacteriaceae bacterium]
MKNKITLIFLLFVGLTYAQNQNPIMVKYAETITVEDMKEDLTILASDALEGRETGKRGQKMAAAYIRAHFEELGLEAPVPLGNRMSYYQDVKLKTSKVGEIYVKIDGKKLTNSKDFLYYGKGSNTDEITTEVIFLGSGSEKEFENIDVKDKSILVINSDRMKRREILNRATEKGVEMVFVVRSNTDEEFKTFIERFGKFFSRESLGLDRGEEGKEGVGAFYISPSKAGEIVGKPYEKLTKAIESFNSGELKALKKIKPKNVQYKLEFIQKKIISENVLGYLEGTDLKDELLVLTAHYDHLGIHDGKIFNGADDDGSGTVAVMDIAEAFVQAKKDGHGPRRSILFMAVTAEEKGLLGSEFYVENPIFSLESTVADLNIDMIGRIDDRELESENYVSLVGSDKLSTELHEISERMNNTYTNLFLDYTYNDENHPERIYYRSDHWNFAKNGIPVIFYTTGSHPDYHKETDTVDKIEFELMRKRAQLVFYTAWEIANRDKRLVVDKATKEN